MGHPVRETYASRSKHVGRACTLPFANTLSFDLWIFPNFPKFTPEIVVEAVENQNNFALDFFYRLFYSTLHTDHLIQLYERRITESK